MRKVIEYDYVRIDTVHTKVNKMINDGWQPWGSMVFDPAMDGLWQAMVKYESEGGEA